MIAPEVDVAAVAGAGAEAGPLPGRRYRIALCSGEERCWRYLGRQGETGQWQDEESGQSFSEASVMYAWRIIAAEPVAPDQPGDSSPGSARPPNTGRK